MIGGSASQTGLDLAQRPLVVSNASGQRCHVRCVQLRTPGLRYYSEVIEPAEVVVHEEKTDRVSMVPDPFENPCPGP